LERDNLSHREIQLLPNTALQTETPVVALKIRPILWEAHTNLSVWLSAGARLNEVIDMVCIATGCAKRACQTRLLAQALSKSSAFLICMQGRS
jgi:hypothetical protein